MKGECPMIALDKLLSYINQLDDYQQELVLSFIVTLFDLDD